MVSIPPFAAEETTLDLNTGETRSGYADPGLREMKAPDESLSEMVERMKAESMAVTQQYQSDEAMRTTFAKFGYTPEQAQQLSQTEFGAQLLARAMSEHGQKPRNEITVKTVNVEDVVGRYGGVTSVTPSMLAEMTALLIPAGKERSWVLMRDPPNADGVSLYPPSMIPLNAVAAKRAQGFRLMTEPGGIFIPSPKVTCAMFTMSGSRCPSKVFTDRELREHQRIKHKDQWQESLDAKAEAERRTEREEARQGQADQMKLLREQMDLQRQSLQEQTNQTKSLMETVVALMAYFGAQGKEMDPQELLKAITNSRTPEAAVAKEQAEVLSREMNTSEVEAEREVEMDGEAQNPPSERIETDVPEPEPEPKKKERPA